MIICDESLFCVPILKTKPLLHLFNCQHPDIMNISCHFMPGPCNTILGDKFLPDCCSLYQFGYKIVYTDYLDYIYITKACHQKILMLMMLPS